MQHDVNATTSKSLATT